jgi:hypothetical protein
MSKKMAKKGKRMAFGGPVGYGGNKTNDPVGRGGMGGTGLGGVSGGINAGGGGRGGPAGGVTTGTMTGTSERNMRGTSMEPEYKTTGPSAPMNRPKKSLSLPPVAPPQEMETAMPRGGLMYGDGSMWPGQATTPRIQRGYSVRGGSEVTATAGSPVRSGSGSPINAPGGKADRELGYGAGTGDRKMRGGGLARKGKTMAKGGLVKGCGCVAKGVKKPRYT